MIARRLLDDCLMTVCLLLDDFLETLEILVIVNGEWLRDIIKKIRTISKQCTCSWHSEAFPQTTN